MVYQESDSKEWLESETPTMEAWEGSRLKFVGLDALPTYKRLAAWFRGHLEDTERLFLRLRRLNRGLNTETWRGYERS